MHDTFRNTRKSFESGDLTIVQQASSAWEQTFEKRRHTYDNNGSLPLFEVSFVSVKSVTRMAVKHAKRKIKAPQRT